jgi:transketolase
MAQYSQADIKFVGSHAGVSIGPDGASQMGLEDISMFLAMPEAVVLYPSDAVSCEKLVKEMARHKGISYLRTTRDKTPVLYENDEEFPIGGCKVLRQSAHDQALVIATGITVHEALRAYETLKSMGVNVRVIDLYSIKPLDENGLRQNAEACAGKVLTVEDHYCGAIGAQVAQVAGQVTSLCVKEIPRSGKSAELLHKYGIDSQAIIAACQALAAS